MDRIYQWAWDRHGARYSWATYAIAFPILLQPYLVTAFVVVAIEGSGRYVEAAVAAVVGALVVMYVWVLPGIGQLHLTERWAAKRDHEIDRVRALEGTYTWGRGAAGRMIVTNGIFMALVSVVVGAIAGAGVSRLVQYWIVGAAFGAAAALCSVHPFTEGVMRPVRVAIIGDTGIGDLLPRSRPTFAAWSNIFFLGSVFAFAIWAVLLAAVFDRVREMPVLSVVIAGAVTLAVGVPTSVGAASSAIHRPIRDLAEGTQRVAAGDYSQRLPVVQDDDLGALAGSFNRMQAGLAERQRLQAAFGTYVDPSLAARLLEQGDDVFTGERRQVTVMFVDVRDFTPFAEANTAEDTVARLNALFEIVVPAVVDAGGHVNKFLGDGALAVFGAPNDLADHADAALTAALAIHRLVAERFGGQLRIGVGINTGVVIAGTIGGGGKLEFTLIGDTVNVAARVEQLTKTTGDAILLTHHTADALNGRSPELIDRGPHALKGKSALVQLFSVEPGPGV
jgi:class 3 adenylate cyclase